MKHVIFIFIVLFTGACQGGQNDDLDNEPCESRSAAGPCEAIGFEPQGLEWLFAQSVFISQLNTIEKQKVVEICLKNDSLRQEYPYWDFLLKPYSFTALVLIGRTMLAADYKPFVNIVNDDEELQFFLDGWRIICMA